MHNCHLFGRNQKLFLIGAFQAVNAALAAAEGVLTGFRDPPPGFGADISRKNDIKIGSGDFSKKGEKQAVKQSLLASDIAGEASELARFIEEGGGS